MSEAASAALFQLSPTTGNALLLAAQAIMYFAVLAGLFRARHRHGIGAFFCALGVMHFLETYLASVLYVPLPFGIVASPGSTVLFSGKLMLLLLVYIREDAVVVRQPIVDVVGAAHRDRLAMLGENEQRIPVAEQRLTHQHATPDMRQERVRAKILAVQPDRAASAHWLDQLATEDDG